MTGSHVGARGIIDIYATVSELDPSDPLAQVAVVLNPPSIYLYTSTGYQLIGASTPTTPATPASENGHREEGE
jgi:hypothetical protein